MAGQDDDTAKIRISALTTESKVVLPMIRVSVKTDVHPGTGIRDGAY